MIKASSKGSGKRIRWLIIVIVFIMAIYFFYIGQQRIKERTAQLALEAQQYQTSVREVTEQNDALKDELSRAGTDAFIENTAREYGFYKEGEIRFEIINPEALTGVSGEVPQAAALESAQTVEPTVEPEAKQTEEPAAAAAE